MRYVVALSPAILRKFFPRVLQLFLLSKMGDQKPLHIGTELSAVVFREFHQGLADSFFDVGNDLSVFSHLANSQRGKPLWVN